LALGILRTADAASVNVVIVCLPIAPLREVNGRLAGRQACTGNVISIDIVLGDAKGREDGETEDRADMHDGKVLLLWS